MQPFLARPLLRSPSVLTRALAHDGASQCSRWSIASTAAHARCPAAAATVRPTASLARSVRPVPIMLITVAKGNSKGAELMASEWADKLRRYTQLTEVWDTEIVCLLRSSAAATDAPASSHNPTSNGRRSASSPIPRMPRKPQWPWHTRLSVCYGPSK